MRPMTYETQKIYMHGTHILVVLGRALPFFWASTTRKRGKDSVYRAGGRSFSVSNYNLWILY